jgi:hypothetical protein
VFSTVFLKLFQNGTVGPRWHSSSRNSSEALA